MGRSNTRNERRKSVFKIRTNKLTGKRPLVRPGGRREGNIK